MWSRPEFGPIGRLAAVVGACLLSGCGGAPSRLEFHEDQAGNFRVLAAGQPKATKQNLSSAAGPLELTAIESVDANRIRRVVAYTDIPQAAVQSSGPDALLDGGVKGMGGSGRWKVEGQSPIALDGHPGREVRFAASTPAGGSGRARIFLVGNRLYQAIMVGPAANVTDEELDHYVKSFELLHKVPVTAATVATAAPAPVATASPAPTPAPAPAVAANEPEPAAEPRPAAPAPRQAVAVRRNPFPRPAPPRPPFGRPARAPRPPGPNEERPVQTEDDGPDISRPAAVVVEAGEEGGYLTAIPDANGNERERFRDLAPQRGVLVGFRAGYVEIFGGPKIGTLQPIFQVGNRYVPGKKFGGPMPLETTVVARPGYAVGAIRTRTGLTVDAFQITFMRFRDGRLDPDDAYATNWLGDPRGGGPRDASGDGKLIVGIHGRSNGREINGLGLLAVE